MQTQQATVTAAVDHGPDAVALLIDEHERLRSGLRRLISESDGQNRRDQLRAFARRLVGHETAEQSVIYPVIARIDGGSEFRRELLQQERVLGTALARLSRRLLWRPGGRRTLRRIRSFSRLLDDHLAFEEDSLLPILLALEDDRKRQLMGTWLRYVEAWTPTRPHPHAPQHLPGLLTIGVGLGFVDRVRDRAFGRIDDTSSRNGTSR